MALHLRLLAAYLALTSCCVSVIASNRELQSVSLTEHVSIPYNRSISGGDPLGQLSLTDPRLQRTVTGLTPEQVSILQHLPF